MFRPLYTICTKGIIIGISLKKMNIIGDIIVNKEDRYKMTRKEVKMKYFAPGLMIMLIAFLALYGCGDKSTGPSDNLRDLVLNLNNMDSNVGQKITVRVMSSDNVMESEAVIDVLESANGSIKVPNIIDDSTYHIDMYADANDNGSYDPPPVDDAWRVAVPASGVVNFTYNTDVTDIANPAFTTRGNSFIMNFFNFGPQAGKTVELRVLELPDNRTVGAYRLDEIPFSGVFTIYLPGIILNGSGYAIAFYIDMNVNDEYDPPPEDEAWLINGGGTSTGLEIDFTHNTNWKDIKF